MTDQRHEDPPKPTSQRRAWVCAPRTFATLNDMPSAPADRPIWWVSARSGISAALAGLAGALVVVVICWLPDAGVSGRPTSAIRAGILAFLTAHGGGITLNGVGVRFTPLLMTAVVVVIAWRAGRTLAGAADDDSVARDLLTALGSQTAAYAAVCGVLVLFSRLGTTHVSFLPTVIAAFVLFGLVSGSAFARNTDLGDKIIGGLPNLVVTGARGAAGTLAVYVAAGTLLTLGSLILHAGQVMGLSRQVGGGLSGLPILVLGMVSAPNAVLAGSSYLAGPGFAVGSGTSVNAFSTSHGVLPAFPILGAIPNGHGGHPVVLSLMAITALGAGATAAVGVRRSGAASLGAWSAGVVATAAATGIAMAVLAWLGGGAAGPGRLQTVGASSWRLGLATAATVGVVGQLIVLGSWGWLWLSDRTPTAAEAPEPELADSRR